MSGRQGSTNPFYDSPEWQAKRAYIRKRDGNKCTMAGDGRPCSGRLYVDHILSLKSRPDLALDDSNLRTLCHAHHEAVTRRGFTQANPHQQRKADAQARLDYAVAALSANW